MTGAFVRCPRPSVCVSLNCSNRIVPGAWVYLFMNSDRQMVCIECAKRRWNYAPPEDTPAVLLPTKLPTTVSSFATFDRSVTGGTLRKNILNKRELEQANANDPKLRQAGGDR
jgi:hypothetical protein